MTDIKDQAIVFQCDYENKAPGETTDKYNKKGFMKQFTAEQLKMTPDFQDIHITDVTCRGTRTAIKASGILDMNCVHDIDIRNSTFVYRQDGDLIDPQTAHLTLENVKLIKE